MKHVFWDTLYLFFELYLVILSFLLYKYRNAEVIFARCFSDVVNRPICRGGEWDAFAPHPPPAGQTIISKSCIFSQEIEFTPPKFGLKIKIFLKFTPPAPLRKIP